MVKPLAELELAVWLFDKTLCRGGSRSSMCGTQAWSVDFKRGQQIEVATDVYAALSTNPERLGMSAVR